MKNYFNEFIPLTETEKDSLWKNSIFVFDTNILLNLYRYSESTSSVLLEAFNNLNNKIWLPYNVAKEFFLRRCSIILEVKRTPENLKNESLSFLNACRNSFYITENDVKDLSEYINNWINEKNNKRASQITPNNDFILDDLLKLFKNKIGDPFDANRITEIEKEGAVRYSDKIPPGYKDNPKKGETDLNNCYGDLIIWKQIIEYSKIKKCNIIFVTDDKKEDWWLNIKGETIGPRYELISEFKKETDKVFLMYNMNSFISYYQKYVNQNDINSNVIEEIDFITNKSNNEQSIFDVNKKFYYRTISNRPKSIRPKNWEYFVNIKENYRTLKKLEGELLDLANTEKDDSYIYKLSYMETNLKNMIDQFYALLNQEEKNFLDEDLEWNIITNFIGKNNNRNYDSKNTLANYANKLSELYDNRKIEYYLDNEEAE